MEETFFDNEIDYELAKQKAEETYESLGYSFSCSRGAKKTFENGYVTITVFPMGDKGHYIWDLYERQKEWAKIDELVMEYQKQFKEDCTPQDKSKANLAGAELIERFSPLFKKYMILLTTGQINFRNAEQLSFVRLFSDLKLPLNPNHVSEKSGDILWQNFNFIIEAYGKQDDAEILEDLHMAFFVLARRYQPQGKSFCCYIYNSFKFEVARHIKDFQKNPINFHYKVAELDEKIKIEDDTEELDSVNTEDNRGILNSSWISGKSCDALFADLTPEDRMILVKYYLENYKSVQVAEMVGCHVNTLNKQRKIAIEKIAKKLGIRPEEIKHHRNSGKKIVK